VQDPGKKYAREDESRAQKLGAYVGEAANFGINDAKAAADSNPLNPILNAGLTLIPLNGKVPTDLAWQKRCYDSAELAANLGTCNLGVRIPPNLLVVDVDPRNGGDESFKRLAEDAHLDVNAYPRVRTGGDGLHVYMWLPEGSECVTHHDRYPGIDFKSSGQVVAPGSIHPLTGKAYVGEDLWMLALQVPANDALLSLLKRRERHQTDGGAHRAGELTPDMLAKNLDQLDPDNFGQGAHDAWVELMMASHHATDGEGRDEFIAWSTQAAGYQDHAEIIGKRWDSLRVGDGGITVASLYRLVNAAGGAPVDMDSPENDFAQAYDGPLPVPTKEDKRWKFLSLEELEALPPPKWLIGDLIQEDTIVAIYGAPESGKSFLAIDMVMSVASARAWHGREVLSGAVLYIAAEGARGLGKRVNAWKTEHGVDAVPFHLMCDDLNLTSEQEAAAFCRDMVKTLGPLRMIVIDTLNQTSTGSDENSAQDMGRYVKAMKRMRDLTGATVIVVHHSGKDATKGMRGSTALLGGFDTTIEVIRPDEEGMSINVRIRKQKDGEKATPMRFEMAKIAESLVLRVTMEATKGTDEAFIGTPLRDWVAREVLASGGRMAFKALVEARVELTKGKERMTRINLQAVLAQGQGNAKPSSDGTRIWMERKGGNSRGELEVFAIAGDS
jgi:hypothetical protein